MRMRKRRRVRKDPQSGLRAMYGSFSAAFHEKAGPCQVLCSNVSRVQPPPVHYPEKTKAHTARLPSALLVRALFGPRCMLGSDRGRRCNLLDGLVFAEKAAPSEAAGAVTFVRAFGPVGSSRSGDVSLIFMGRFRYRVSGGFYQPADASTVPRRRAFRRGS